MSLGEPSRLPAFHIFSAELEMAKIHYTIRAFPCNEVLVVLPDDAEVASTKSRLEQLFTNLGLQAKWIELQSGNEDFWGQITPILSVISQLNPGEYEYYINLDFKHLPSTIAAYILGSILHAKLFIIPETNSDILEIAPIPLKTIDPISLDILITLYDLGGFSPSLKTTVKKGNWVSKSDTPLKALAQASYFVKKLEKDNLVETIRRGKELSVRLTGAGKWYAILKKEDP